MKGKERISVSVDAALAEEARAFVAAGRAESFSAYVNAALRAYSQHERRLAALEIAIAAYEAEFGPITEEEMAEHERWVAENAIHVRPKRRRPRSA